MYWLVIFSYLHKYWTALETIVIICYYNNYIIRQTIFSCYTIIIIIYIILKAIEVLDATPAEQYYYIPNG